MHDYIYFVMKNSRITDYCNVVASVLLNSHPSVSNRYRRIVKYKTSYYSFYLLVACALLLNGAKLSDYVELKNVLIEMGVYFQIQDDYLDCFGDPEVIGKVGTDIEDYKYSWLVVQAMELANENEMKILHIKCTRCHVSFDF